MNPILQAALGSILRYALMVPGLGLMGFMGLMAQTNDVSGVTSAGTGINMLNKVIPYLLNPYTGTILFVIALGYVVRAVPFIANKYIPLLGILSGSLFFLGVAPLTMKPDPEHAWNWYVMIWGAGLVLSSFAWLIHLVVISRLEDWARTRIPAMDAWFKKTSDDNSGMGDNKQQGKIT